MFALSGMVNEDDHEMGGNYIEGAIAMLLYVDDSQTLT